jgi:hypothetical protein
MCNVKWRFVISVCCYVPSNDVTHYDVRYFVSISTRDRTNYPSIYMTNPLTTNKLTFPYSYGSRFVPLLMHGRQTLTWHNCTVMCAHWHHLAISTYKQRIRLTCCTYVSACGLILCTDTHSWFGRNITVSQPMVGVPVFVRGKLKKSLILNYFK